MKMMFRSLALVIVALIVSVSHVQASELYPADERAMKRQLSTILNQAEGVIKRWKGPNGSGEITLSLAFSQKTGSPCKDIASCESACRKMSYTFVGERKDGMNVNVEKAANVCNSSGSWEYSSGEKIVNEVVLGKSPGLLKREEDARRAAETQRKANEDRQRQESEARQRQQLAAQKAREDRARKNANQQRATLVASIQSKLNNLRYDVGSPDGAIGAQTLSAMEEFLLDERHPLVMTSSADNSDLETLDALLDRVATRQKSVASCAASISKFSACGLVPASAF